MYTIYVDDEPLYVPTLTDSGYGVFSPRLTVELSRAGSLEFTLPPNNVMYDKIKKMTSVVKVYQDDRELFEGRVLHDEKDFYKQKKVYCEGELAYFLDSIVRPCTFSDITVNSALNKLITAHNETLSAEPNKQFTLGDVTVRSDEGKYLRISTEIKNYPNTFDAISSNLLDVFGGHIMVRKENGVRYVDWLGTPADGDPAVTSSQTIEFGVNMLDITEYISAENVFTRIVPLGAEKDGKKITLKTNSYSSYDYITNTSGKNLFGIIERKVDFDEVTTPSKLKTLATDYLKKNIEMAISLTVRAIDLEGLYVNADAIHLGDWVQVVSLPHDLNKPFRCMKIVYNLDSPDQNEYSFGVEYESLTSQQVKNKKGAANLSSIVIEEE